MSTTASSLPPIPPSPQGPPPAPPQEPQQESPQEPPESPEQIAATLAEQGWCVTDAFVPPLLVGQLRHEARERWDAGAFRRAGVGRGADRELRPEVRTDRILWLEPAALSGAQQCLWERLEAVRLAVNRQMFLGLQELEAHFAVYPAGAYYRKHLDQFHGMGRRQLSCVLYLGEDWQAADGGALRMYVDTTDAVVAADVLPVGGRLVSFLSARFLHEVLPARRERLSITGWFRSR
ncbi:2OG-Fe(II) oxygenase [Thiohalocapsa halophila]|uniref:2OG-Fe(II) oxygenase n=1 Tax=Thiohalocapsa halophila TaxID=69359 RepID=UPI001908E0CB|nr:2OG-Fe(II) oxygenase [Thiohalocapsa halophila]